VAEALSRRGTSVRAMVRAETDRDRLPAGVQPVVADFDDPASIAAALHGARRAYLVTPSSERAEAQQRRFADLAVQAGVGHLVVLSQLGADEQSPVRFLRYHAAVERHIRDLGIAYTFLRPNLFFQGLLAFAATIAADGGSTPRAATPRSAPWTSVTSPRWAPPRSPKPAMTARPTT